MCLKTFVLVGVALATVLQAASGVIVDITPKSTTEFPGKSVPILCTSNNHLTYCRFTIPGIGDKVLSPKTPYNREFNYRGTGLENGQCGVTLESVVEMYNGNVTCEVGTETDPNPSRATMQLIVARAPNTPVLAVSPNSDEYRENDNITASCTISAGRPVATIKWYLGDVELNSDEAMQDVVSRTGDLHTAEQNVTRTLTPDDNDKLLKCEGGHVAYGTKKRTDEKRIIVKYAPIVKPDKQMNFLIGETGTIDVNVQANPKPNISWMVGGVAILEDNQKYTFSLTDSEAFLWTARLSVLNVTEDDYGNDYALTARNQEGEITRQVDVVRPTTPSTTDGDTLGRDVGIGIAVTLAIVAIAVLGGYMYRDKVSELWRNITDKKAYAPPPDAATTGTDVSDLLVKYSNRSTP